jgi:hypothetical protein
MLFIRKIELLSGKIVEKEKAHSPGRMRPHETSAILSYVNYTA